MKLIKPFDELTIQDNFMFKRVMQNKELCKTLIEKLLHIKVKDITYPTENKAINMLLPSRGVRVKVHVGDDTDKIYDVEMQCTYDSTNLLVKYMRHEEDLMTDEQIRNGTPCEELNDTYIIFICTYDPFSNGLAKYEFGFRCKENPKLDLDDGQTEIFLNAKGADAAQDPFLAAFLRYVDGKDMAITDPFIEKLDEEVAFVKKLGQVRREYRLLADEFDRWALEWQERERLRITKNMFKAGFSDEQVMQATFDKIDLDAKHPED
ncbi:MAG: Rpn family recombination-promoting nuclease/putative transposase [Acidaminococcus sp.]|jgi:predicted transposase/invertase (TIGR01784 family)|nr:Rpn family recombination-promoting nuclease/putative transposase [Acidaminococcus sp.]MCI2117247.1 Rpn family recombination-promoting nuclease/putative transposase [Acidaminococcus sp.]